MSKLKIKVKDIEFEARSFNLQSNHGNIREWIDYIWKIQNKGEKEK